MCFVSILYIHIQSPHMWRVCDVTASINGVYVSLSFAYGHTTLNTPDLVWSRKLSRVGPGQYLDGRPPGNTRCCKLLHFLLQTAQGAAASSMQTKQEGSREGTYYLLFNFSLCDIRVELTGCSSPVCVSLWHQSWPDRLQHTCLPVFVTSALTWQAAAHLSVLHRLILSYSKMCFVSIQYLHIQSLHMWPGQYLDGRPPGNTKCCKLLSWVRK